MVFSRWLQAMRRLSRQLSVNEEVQFMESDGTTIDWQDILGQDRTIHVVLQTNS